MVTFLTPTPAVTVTFTVTWSFGPGDAGEMVGVLIRSPGGAATVAIAGRNSKSERANAILFECGDKGFPLKHGGPETYLSCNSPRAMEALLCTYKVHSRMEKSVHKIGQNSLT